MQIRYMIQMNLAGLHNNIIYICKAQKNPYTKKIEYYTRDKNHDCADHHEKDLGCYKLVYKTKKEAIAAMEGAQMVASMIKERLK